MSAARFGFKRKIYMVYATGTSIWLADDSDDSVHIEQSIDVALSAPWSTNTTDLTKGARQSMTVRISFLVNAGKINNDAVR